LPPITQPSPQVHDLLLLQSGITSFADVVKPVWITSLPAGKIWGVVRRATAPDGLVAVGVRGVNRQQRWGGFADLVHIIDRLRPSQLSSNRTCPTRGRVPALAALCWLEGQLNKSELEWGPVGSVGFELATGQQVVTGTSDLDIAVFAPTRFTRDTARHIWSLMKAAPTKIDVLVETPYCGFSLEEYAREESKKVLVRLPEGWQFATDPWDISVI